jgi:hypothetical protein
MKIITKNHSVQIWKFYLYTNRTLANIYEKKPKNRGMNVLRL